MPVPRMPRLARSPILKLGVEALEDRWLASVSGSSLALAPALMRDGSVFVSAPVLAAPTSIQVKAHLFEVRAEDTLPRLAASAQIAAIYNPKEPTGRAAALRQGLDPDWREDLREQALHRSSDSAGPKLTLAAKHMIVAAEAAFNQIAARQKQTDIKQFPAMGLDTPRTALAAMEGRSDLPREAEPPTWPISARSAEAGSGAWQILSILAAVPLPGDEPRLVRLTGVPVGPSPGTEPDSVALRPMAAGMLGDILTFDVAALEQGMHYFLEQVSAASQWVLAETAGARPGGWLLATLAAGALAAEVIHHRRRLPALPWTGGAPENSYWSFPSRLTELAWDQEP